MKERRITIKTIHDSEEDTDMSVAMQIITNQIDEGYTSGTFSDIAWDIKEVE